MNAPIRRVALTVFVLIGVLIAAVTYLQVITGPEYRDDPRNVRVIAGRAGRERGTIVSSDGTVVARSVTNPEDPRVFRRTYPHGELYSHAVGYATLLFGSTGLEDARSGLLVSDRDSTISGVIEALLGEDVRAQGIVLTIDHDLQRIASEALGDRTGAVVAIDPSTGAVLAMVSKPDFDPNVLLGTGAATAGDELAAREDRPLLNRAIGEIYAPGSTFKVITAAAALETGAAGAATTYPNPVELDLPGTSATIRNFDRSRCGSGSTITLMEAMALSCNTTFAMIGLELGAAPLVATAANFGFSLDNPFELRAAPSSIPEVSAFADDEPAVAQSAIGQRDVRATPLQMAMVAAAVANSGSVMTPYLVHQTFNAEGDIVSETTPQSWRRAISPSTAGVLADLMESVVTSGTGGRAAVPGIRIAGKTGTAEVPSQTPSAWFIGFGPVDAVPGSRQIAIAIIIEDAGSGATGGSVAAPIAHDVLEAFFSG